MAMACRSGEIIGPMALDTGRIWGDGHDLGPVARILQDRRDGADVAITALIGMNGHRVIGLMTTNTKRGVKDMAQARRRPMIDADMGQRRFLVQMTAEAEHRGLVGVGDDHLHCSVSGRKHVDITTGVMASDAAVSPIGMGGQNIIPTHDRMTGRARLRIGLTKIGGQIDLHGMNFGATVGPVGMVIEEAQMTGDAFARAPQCRTLAETGRHVMAGGTPPS